MRILVGIPNYGTKNRPFLDRVLAGFDAMPHDVHVVVNTEAPRDYPAGVENIVGLPTENPRSLPFAHRTLFAERIDEHDLFVYVEDDTLVETRHVDMFLAATELLPDTDVAGFLRFERYNDRDRSICSVHSSYRWDPSSVVAHGGERFAHFTNLHAACYMLTQDQLRRCIDSGGYLVEPHAGRYQMLESAATDPYVQCGLRKMIAVDRFEDTLLHHLPELYLGRLGEREERMRRGVEALDPAGDTRSAFDPDASLPTFLWDLDLYLRLPGPALDLVDGTHRRVLTIGGAGGRAEQQLLERGAHITSIPLDAVLGAQLAADGVSVTAPDLDEGLAAIADDEFDLVVLTDTLAFVPDPSDVVRRAAARLHPNGAVVAVHRSGAFEGLRDSIAAKRIRRPENWTHREHGRWPATAGWLRATLAAAGLDVEIRGTGEGDQSSPAERLVPKRLQPALLPFTLGIGRPRS
ncbi:MAG: methyltransferase domain-containing protein [Actinomycetota bacterium]